MPENDLISRSALWTDIMMLPHNGDIISSEEVEQTIVEAPAVDVVDIEKALAWLEDYSILDRHEVYTNGTLLVPLFRVEQALVHKAYNGLRGADDGK